MERIITLIITIRGELEEISPGCSGLLERIR